ncbi:glycosyltransferase family 2 protein [Methanocella sp. CWC-04]|uniref:Glycosyltransferase family 2 protein n=1 Tax=Methanooceanicella nereidis TaxID=2052831 RepID=A0AAP2W4E7_9EURY|nr:glycosyltransferase family 2 protein [Methanocella sp. CWC-04]MCD1294180.1 glycosyltransferase family 2 protein [Methanocella sp. CWC-04]
MAPHVSIILLNWNGKDDTVECLRSLSHITFPDHEIILVDNASTDGSQDYFAEKYPDIVKIFNDENLGFAEGNNVGIRYALKKGTDYVLLLNNDTVVEPDFLSGLVSVAESDSKIGIAGPKICFYSHPGKIWAAGGKNNMFTGSIINLGELDPEEIYKGTKKVDFVSGCALLIKAEVIEKIGLLTTDYFLYFEDADWNVRAQKEGYLSVVNCDAKILHKSGISVKKTKDSNYYYISRNILLFIKRNGKWYHKMVFYPKFFLQYTAAFILHMARGETTKSRYILKGIKDHLTGKYGRL